MVPCQRSFPKVSRLKPSRKSAFRAALALARMTQGEFAAREGVSESYLSLVLNEHRESERLRAAIDAFTARHLPQTVTAVAS